MPSLSLRIERIDPLTPQIRRLILVAGTDQPLPGRDRAIGMAVPRHRIHPQPRQRRLQ
ncbi:hypothetical protein [Pseudomonas karstica]|uniref:hypothetical protein n=1 Tax=Pseudomonas karstica TaxID=1055468 RepID=UPI0015B4C9C7